jgi:hypothetical protein
LFKAILSFTKKEFNKSRKMLVLLYDKTHPMKAFIISVSILISTNCFAGHARAMHMYYDHIPNTNKYIFTALFHTEPALSNITQLTINSNSPTSQITAYLKASIPVGGSMNSCVPLGAIGIYKSDTINLGTVPLLGYKFTVQGTSRASFNSNLITNSTPIYIGLHMYPEPGQTYASSSPRMVNPVMQQITNVPNLNLSLPAKDPDNDSIYYKLSPVLNSATGQPLNYSTGFSSTDPFGTSTGATINQNTGTLSATNVLFGYYLINYEIESYKNGTLTSALQTEYVVATAVNPIPVPIIALTNSPNSGRQAVFKNDVYYINMLPGDSANFSINGSVLFNDSIFISGSGDLFGNSLGTSGNCSSDCADFTSPTQFKALTSVSGDFNFLADSSHVVNNLPTKYTLVFTASSKDSCSALLNDNLIVHVSVENTFLDVIESELNNVSIFPNPSSGLIIIERLLADKEQIYITDMAGRIFLRTEIIEPKSTLDLTQFEKGTYLICSEKGWSKKIILN